MRILIAAIILITCVIGLNSCMEQIAIVEYPPGYIDSDIHSDENGHTVVTGIVSSVRIEQAAEFVRVDWVYLSDGRVLRVDLAPAGVTNYNGLQIGSKYKFVIDEDYLPVSIELVP
jgi:hypothetical protein